MFGVDTHTTNKILPICHFPVNASIMSIHPHLFGIRTTGAHQIRTDKGIVARHKKTSQMSPLGRERL